MFFSSIKLGKNLDGTEVSEGPEDGLVLDEDTGERVFRGNEVDKKACLLSKPEPNYTEEARKNKITGTVVLRVVLSKTGHVNTIRVVSGLPYGLTKQAVEAAQKIKFVPALKDGESVSTLFQLEYNFNP